VTSDCELKLIILHEKRRGGARRSEEERGGARRSEEERGGARRSEEERGGARRSEEERGDSSPPSPIERAAMERENHLISM
jgi:hypothetical protein